GAARHAGGPAGMTRSGRSSAWAPPMPYRFARERLDYADFASGRVFRSLPGRTGFPVRLADELFQRCLAIRSARGHHAPAVLYDPCCGGATLLCTLAYQPWPALAQIIASDADPD